MVDFPDHPFWDFSIEIYARKGVGAACIALQEAHGIDVNLLLFCLWHAASGRGALSDASVARLIAASGPWHRDVVRALRAIRRRMKEGIEGADPALAEPLRKEIARIEIETEHAEQLLLGAHAAPQAGEPAPRDAVRAAAAAVSVYFGALGARLSADDRAALAAILAAAFQTVDANEISTLCAAL